MSELKLTKKISEKIGRAFAIMYNRASMYKIDHQFTNQSIQEVYNVVTEGLDLISPVALILNREQFFIEEEPFDHRLNTSRMAAHFKKTGIQSISFEKGMVEADLKSFVKIFVDPNNYPKASLMQNALAELSVSSVKINHVIYKKMTADDEIVSKEDLNQSSKDSANTSSDQMFGEVLNMMAESALVEEIEKSFSLKNLIEDPIKLSNDLISKDYEVAKGEQTASSQSGPAAAGGGGPATTDGPAAAGGGGPATTDGPVAAGGGGPATTDGPVAAGGSGPATTDGPVIAGGPVIASQLARIREEVLEMQKGIGDINISDLADAVSDMRDELIKGIEAQKALGVIYENEEQIIDEANALTDQVLIQLVKKEYQEGNISTKRLAQIIRRMVPDSAELKRILPLIKDALIEEGMALSEFMGLIDALGKELNNEELAKIFQRSAAEVGLDSDDLIQEFKRDPSGAAELIYLAAELRKGTGDDKILTELLVEYIERIGSKIVLDTTNSDGNANDDHVKKVIANVESDIVNRLDKKGIDDEILKGVQEKLMERMEECFNKLKKDWERQQASTTPTTDVGQTTIFRILEESVDEGDELHSILNQVGKTVKEREIDENDIHKIFKEIKRINKKKKSKKNGNKLPAGILNYKNTLFFIEKEISRSNRYETPFSVITFSIIKIEPKQPIPKSKLSGQKINQAVMGELIKSLRSADLVGILTKNILVVLLPMTEKENARIALRRLIRSLHEAPITINGYDLKVRFAGAVTSFNEDQTPDLDTFLKVVENDHNELVIRLKNVHVLY